MWADIGMGIGLRYQDRIQEGESRLLGALAGAQRLEDPEVALTAAGILSGLAPADAAYAAAEALVDTPAAQGNSYAAALFQARAWGQFLMHGQQERAEAARRRASEVNQRLRDPFLEVLGLLQTALELAIAGRLEEALAAARALPARGLELGSPDTGAVYGALVGFRPSIWLGHVAEAMAGVEGVALVGQREDLALCLALLRREEEAREAVRRRMAEVGIGTQHAPEWYGSAATLLDAAVTANDRESAAGLLERVAPMAGLSFPVLVHLTCPARVLGDACAFLGQPEQARAYYLQALENCAKIGFRPEAALAHLGLAELGLQHYPRERADAMRHLDAAIAELRDMKMQPSLERALKHRDILKA